MDFNASLGFYSYGLGAAAFLFVGFLYLLTLQKAHYSRVFSFLLLSSFVWCVVLTLSQTSLLPGFRWVAVSDFVRTLGWLYLLQVTAGYTFNFNIKQQLRNPLSPVFLTVLVGIACLSMIFLGLPLFSPVTLETIWMLVLSVLGLLLVEQVFRNTPVESRYSVKLVCISAGAIFAYDFFVFSNAFLMQGIDYEFWSARGLVSVLAIPTLMMAAVRNPHLAPNIHVSRRFVLHSTTLFATGGYLVLMAIAGSYIQETSAEWGKLAQAAFLVIAAILLALLFFSTSLRSRVRRYLNYSFQNKYDYQAEWDRFSRTLLTHDEESSIYNNAIKACAQIVESRGGVLWLKNGDQFDFKVAWQAEPRDISSITVDAGILDLIRQRQGLLKGSEIDDYLKTSQDDTTQSVLFSQYWIVLPLIDEGAIVGLVCLFEPPVLVELDIFDEDLLNMVAMQVTLALILEERSRQLQEAQRFQDLSQMTAFLVHDLKTIFSQLSLMGENAERHKNKPEFVDDMVATVQHASGKMKRLLEQLQNPESASQDGELVNVTRLLKETEARFAGVETQVLFEPGLDGSVDVSVDGEQFKAALQHIVQNAVDSSGRQGRVLLHAKLNEGNQVEITVRDNGVGMSQDFVANELFRPFKSTKGVSGMGVGAFQSREFCRRFGGDLTVESTPGKGSVFTLSLPVHHV